MRNTFIGVALRRCGLAIAALSLLLVGCSQLSQVLDPTFETRVLEIVQTHPEVLLESLQAYQQEQQHAAEQQQLARATAVLEEMAADPIDSIGNSPSRGAESTNYILYEFSDFQCPYCGRSQATIERFLQQHPDVKLVFKHFPLSQIHKEALPAAQAAWAAQQQGAFWPYHDALFANQERLGEAYYLELADRLNLDRARFNRDRERAIDSLQKDIELAQHLELRGTPFFAINSVPLPGAVPLAELEDVLTALQTVQAQPPAPSITAE